MVTKTMSFKQLSANKDAESVFTRIGRKKQGHHENWMLHGVLDYNDCLLCLHHLSLRAEPTEGILFSERKAPVVGTLFGWFTKELMKSMHNGSIATNKMVLDWILPASMALFNQQGALLLRAERCSSLQLCSWCLVSALPCLRGAPYVSCSSLCLVSSTTSSMTSGFKSSSSCSLQKNRKYCT